MSHIWVPRTKIIELNPRGPVSKIGGWFKIEAEKADGSGRRRVLADWFPNLITNFGLNALGTDAGILAVTHVGTSNTTPAVTDTGLNGWLASTTTSTGSSIGAASTAPYYGYNRITRRFNPGVATGTLAEVGIGSSTSNTEMFSHALILDGGGSPTTITVLSDEYLDVTYELRNYPGYLDTDGETPLDPVQSGQTITGVGTRSFTWRPCLVTNAAWAPNSFPVGNDGSTSCTAYTGTLGTVTSSGPSGTTISSDSFTNATYSNNSLERTATAVFGVNDVLTGIQSFRVGWSIGYYQCQLDSTFDIDDTQTLSMTWTTSWDRV